MAFGRCHLSDLQVACNPKAGTPSVEKSFQSKKN